MNYAVIYRGHFYNEITIAPLWTVQEGAFDKGIVNCSIFCMFHLGFTALPSAFAIYFLQYIWYSKPETISFLHVFFSDSVTLVQLHCILDASQ